MVVKGDMPLKIEWLLNDMPLLNDYYGIQIMEMATKLSTLRIDAINDKHRGTYKCLVSNLAGKSELASELKVNGNFCRNTCLIRFRMFFRMVF